MKRRKAPNDIENVIEMVPFVILLVAIFLGLCVTYLA